MRIDSHQHFWQFDADRHQWITNSMKAIRHDFMPKDLKNILASHDIDGSVLVQVDQTENENLFMIEQSKNHDFIKGIVGWVDFSAPNIQERLEFYTNFPLIKGFRHILQAENTASFLQNKSFLEGISQLHYYDYTYDVLIYHHQMLDAFEFIGKFPQQKFVLDHIAKPDIKNNDYKSWARKIKLLAEHQNLMCKLSGMVTENDWNLWNESDFKPYIETVIEAFGPNRVMYGSDWPVCMLAASYSQVFEIVTNYIGELTEIEQSLILGHNAARFYGL